MTSIKRYKELEAVLRSGEYTDSEKIEFYRARLDELNAPFLTDEFILAIPIIKADFNGEPDQDMLDDLYDANIKPKH